MKNLIKCFLLIISFCLTSCYGTDDDSDKTCKGNCNVFKGRVYTEDNVGIPGVQITLFYTLNQIGANYKRIIAKTKTDHNGNYLIQGFIKDNEFNAGYFHLTVDESKIEKSLSNVFYKPSDLIDRIVPGINEYLIPELTNRAQIIDVDYKIPYKTAFTVKLNNFNLTAPKDQFGIGNSIPYGFQGEFNRFFTKQATDVGFGYANAVNTTLTIPGVYGENYLTIYRFKNGSSDHAGETIIIDNPNTNPIFNYTF